MARDLLRIPFTADLLPEVRDFDCGSEPWQIEVSKWLKEEQHGAIEDMQRGCEVWLYATEEDGLVGFGSLAKTNWRWPDAHDPRVPLNIIPNVAVDQRFWGQPNDPETSTFAAQIINDLIFEARRHTERHPLIGLFIHPQNLRARTAYLRVGFEDYFLTYTDPETGTVYRSMLLKLARD